MHSIIVHTEINIGKVEFSSSVFGCYANEHDTIHVGYIPNIV